ncbi:hypothetical protein [Rosenbergiella nectarea]|uniref:hypothetical protein n=1 Tax=Rosenbergiella nectarea TaxID=988801 RepID=UPI001BD92FAF|nr:hypothetical protein [Rosenbergiella nectarea]
MVRDLAEQSQSLSSLRRDAENAHQTLTPIFDKEKEQQRMQTLPWIGEGEIMLIKR